MSQEIVELVPLSATKLLASPLASAPEMRRIIAEAALAATEGVGDGH